MAKVTFIKPDGSRLVIEAKEGGTLMQAGIDGGINGIVAECGGCCQCATCHVYVAAEWRERLAPINEAEEAMLDNTVCERRPESRLSCEIKVTSELDGLVVQLPARQV
jgi:ferredoxin, 2Fe-2S